MKIVISSSVRYLKANQSCFVFLKLTMTGMCLFFSPPWLAVSDFSELLQFCLHWGSRHNEVAEKLMSWIDKKMPRSLLTCCHFLTPGPTRGFCSNMLRKECLYLERFEQRREKWGAFWAVGQNVDLKNLDPPCKRNHSPGYWPEKENDYGCTELKKIGESLPNCFVVLGVFVFRWFTTPCKPPIRITQAKSTRICVALGWGVRWVLYHLWGLRLII